MGHKHRHLFKDDEWKWFCDLGASKHDPEEKKAFYEGVIEQKLADKTWDLFKHFPRSNIPGLGICAEIIELLKRSNEKRMKEQKEKPPERDLELEELANTFSRLIEEGKHLSGKEAS